MPEAVAESCLPCRVVSQVMDSDQTLDSGKRSMYDPDEIEEEQRERDKRNRANAEFKQFVQRVQVKHSRLCTDCSRIACGVGMSDVGSGHWLHIPHWLPSATATMAAQSLSISLNL